MARVLVSDDDPHVLRLVSRILEAAGHDVVSAADSREVVALARRSSIDAVVLDVKMPVSGIEVLEVLRAAPETARLPVLLLSGLGAAADRVHGLRSGADDYLVKPFEPAELVLRVERLVASRAPTSEEAEESAPDDGVERFGRYEVRGVLGRGSMGTVYRGHDPLLEREIALKTIRLDRCFSADRRREMLDRLQREAVAIARCNHPNIVAVYDMGDRDEAAFIAMELVEGNSLGELLQRRRQLPPAPVLPLAKAIAQALEQAHSRQVVHRDVKPGNVLLGRDGAIKVSDFGLAHVVSAMEDESTVLSGTPGYIPPEVIDDGPYAEPGDLFGFGTMLYEALSGGHPLAGSTVREVIFNTLDGNVPPLAEKVPEVPAELDELVHELLALDPAARPTAAAAAERLGDLDASHGRPWSGQDLEA